VAREFRAAWVATVGNIDWPSKPGLSTWEQQQELLAILNRVASLKMNAVVFHIRPGADAFYDSKLEPWSQYLTGRQGRGPEPAWDPLAFAVEQSHKRGLELHAWFNPYRAHYTRDTMRAANTHVIRTNPELVRPYAQFVWMDPGDPEVRRRAVRVVVDVVKRYDIDGVHIDDYFYPYPENDASGRKIDFPDSATYARYRKSGGKLAKDDWRRQNVDLLVEGFFKGVRAAKPWVQVGISPFGIWRPGNPAQIKGFDAYAEIYADSKKWLENGWLDYLAPQLYWPIARPDQSYPVLLDWWLAQNPKHRHIWPGLATYRISDTSGAAHSERRGHAGDRAHASGGAEGCRSHSLQHDGAHARARTASCRSSPRSIASRRCRPASPWLGAKAPGRPIAALERDPATNEWLGEAHAGAERQGVAVDGAHGDGGCLDDRDSSRRGACTSASGGQFGSRARDRGEPHRRGERRRQCDDGARNRQARGFARRWFSPMTRSVLPPQIFRMSASL
jgi:uncharacterized lipoprotein YddW (UPF0748 family)